MKLPDDVKRLLDGPNFAHFSTLMPSGAPQVVPVWVMREGDRILVGTSERSQKARNTARDGRVALSVINQQNPYEEAQVRGRVVEVRRDADLAFMDRVTQKYVSMPWPMRDVGPRQVVLVIEPEKAAYQKLPFQHNPGAQPDA